MKKLLLVLSLLVLGLGSCTENVRAKHWGGDMVINIDRGQKVEEITWKRGSLWYSTRPMEEDEKPVTQTFREESSWGMVEGTVTFVESK